MKYIGKIQRRYNRIEKEFISWWREWNGSEISGEGDEEVRGGIKTDIHKTGKAIKFW